MYTALQATSQTISSFIENRLKSDTTLRAFFDPTFGGTMIVSLHTPEEMSLIPEEGVSIWLYRITEDPELLNEPPERIGPSSLRLPPLPLRLHYLITPVVNRTTANSAETEQRVLGKILQSLYDHPLFRGGDLAGDFVGTPTELRARLEPMTIEDLTRIWNALEQPYQLSVSYEVTVPLIASEIIEDTRVVIEAVPEYGVIVGSNS